MASFYYFYQNPSGFCFFVQIRGFCYLNLTRLTKFKHSRLLITRTHANSNQNRFPLDFFHAYTVIFLPSITRTSHSKLFFLPFRWPLHISLPSILSAWQVDQKRKKVCTVVRNIEFNISKQLCILCLHFLVSSIRLQCIAAMYILIEVLFSQFQVCMILVFFPHPIFLFSHFRLLASNSR